MPGPVVDKQDDVHVVVQLVSITVLLFMDVCGVNID